MQTAAPAIAVAVPVRDEAALLPRLLAALGAQVEVDPARVAICFHLDACRNASESLVAAWRAPFAVHTSRGEAPDANAGRARRAATALAEATGAPLLLTTDADGAPARDWIAAAARALGQVDVVAGRITRDAADPAQARVERYYDRLYEQRRAIDPLPWEPAPRHHATGGANLGFRADAYRALGGFPPVPSGEDAAIIGRAHRLGLRVRRDATVLVETSARRSGRAPDGLAAALGRLDREGGAATAMHHPADEARRWHAQALARAAWASPGAAMSRLAGAVGMAEAALLALAADGPNAESFAARAVATVPGGARLVPLAEAEAALAALEHAGDRAAA